MHGAHKQENAPMSPDPFLAEVGSGNKIYLVKYSEYPDTLQVDIQMAGVYVYVSVSIIS